MSMSTCGYEDCRFHIATVFALLKECIVQAFLRQVSRGFLLRLDSNSSIIHSLDKLAQS